MQPYGSKADRAQSMNHHSFAATFLKETDKILAPFTERERERATEPQATLCACFSMSS